MTGGKNWAQDRGRASLSIGKPVCPCEVGRGGVAEDNKGGRGKQGRTGKGGKVCVMKRKDGECAKGGAKQVVFTRRVWESGGRRKSGESGRLTGTGARQTAGAADGGRHA